MSRFVGRADEVTFIRPQCKDCTHLHLGDFARMRTCDAFPDGIPDVIWTNRHDHKKPYKGDHGIRFDPVVD